MKNKIIILAVIIMTLVGCDSHITGPLIVSKIETNTTGYHTEFSYVITIKSCGGSSDDILFFTNVNRVIGDTIQ